jgi:predicted phage baseplate assembly protein
MSLPSPNLDDRSFQQIVDDVKRQIGRRCPEWTDHNVSDPGVTLIELFAWMTEMMLYRLNQVPEKNYIKFLELIGISLESPMPATTDLYFSLSRAIEDRVGDEAYKLTLAAGDTVAATLQTPTEPAIEFTTDEDLTFVRPHLSHILAAPAELGRQVAFEFTAGWEEFVAEAVKDKGAFRIFSPVPREGDALYLGFGANVSRNVIELETSCIQSAATGLKEDYPAQTWEYWDGSENQWNPLPVTRDTSRGFNRSKGTKSEGVPAGYIELVMPAGLMRRRVAGFNGYWVRCRYTLDLPPIGPNRLRPSRYEASPMITMLGARVTGGVVSASNCAVIRWEQLGHSDGNAGQVFRCRFSPVLERRPGEQVRVGPRDQLPNTYAAWTEVRDFSESGPTDTHYVFDDHQGAIVFGPSLVQPDGTVRQHGAIPAHGANVVLSAYRIGGGSSGNIAAGHVTVLKSSIPYIGQVTNVHRAQGGRDQELLERAKLRARAHLRHRDRAVTAEDFEALACEASSAVARARCIPWQPPRGSSPQPPTGRIGEVRILLIPQLGEDIVPRPPDLRVPDRVVDLVRQFLDERRLLTTVLRVEQPEYLFVSTELSLVADPGVDEEGLALAIRKQLERFLHPLTGGPGGGGWPFRRALTLADVYAQVQQVPGVAFLTDARLYLSQVIDSANGILSPEEAIPAAAGLALGDEQMICTREHRIRVRPISSLGL